MIFLKRVRVNMYINCYFNEHKIYILLSKCCKRKESAFPKEQQEHTEEKKKGILYHNKY